MHVKSGKYCILRKQHDFMMIKKNSMGSHNQMSLLFEKTESKVRISIIFNIVIILYYRIFDYLSRR